MLYAIIKNNIVENVVEAEADFALEQGWKPLNNRAGIGWFYNQDGSYTKPVIVETVNVPTQIDPAQLRLALDDAGLFEKVATEFAKLPAAQRKRLAMEWDRRSVYNRDSPFIEKLRVALAITKEQMDAIFIAGSTL